jgi:hypothetical protein
MNHGETKILRFDKYEYSVVFRSLNVLRNDLIRDGKPTDAVDDVIIKMSKAKVKHERERWRDEAR